MGSPVLNTLVESEEANGCFDAVLIELKDLISSKEKPMSWRKLASFIPLEKTLAFELVIAKSVHTLKEEERHT